MLEISRFSCMLFNQRARVLRLRRTGQPLACNAAAVLPSSLRNGVGILIFRLFEAQLPGPLVPLSMLQPTPHDVTCKTQGQNGVAVSFPVEDLHLLQHAGLSRRSLCCGQSFTDVIWLTSVKDRRLTRSNAQKAGLTSTA